MPCKGAYLLKYGAHLNSYRSVVVAIFWYYAEWLQNLFTAEPMNRVHCNPGLVGRGLRNNAMTKVEDMALGPLGIIKKPLNPSLQLFLGQKQ